MRSRPPRSARAPRPSWPLEDLPFLPDVQLLVYVRVALRDGILRALLTRLLPELLLLRRHWLCHCLLSIRRLLLGRIRIMHLASSEWLELNWIDLRW